MARARQRIQLVGPEAPFPMGTKSLGDLPVTQLAGEEESESLDLTLLRTSSILDVRSTFVGALEPAAYEWVHRGFAP